MYVCMYILFAGLSLSFFLHLFLTYLLPYLIFPFRINPLRFHAGCHKRRLNLALVFLVSVLCCSTFLFIVECMLRFSFDAVWLGGRKGIRPVKTEWWGSGVVICLEWGADLHMAQLMPLLLSVSCFSKIQIGFTFLVPAHPGSPGKGPLNGCVECMLRFSFLPCQANRLAWGNVSEMTYCVGM